MKKKDPNMPDFEDFLFFKLPDLAKFKLISGWMGHIDYITTKSLKETLMWVPSHVFGGEFSPLGKKKKKKKKKKKIGKFFFLLL